MTRPETSIVIRAYNEEHHLPRLLKEIRTQAYHDYEIIVVDSGSFDNTRRIAKENCDKIVRVSSHDFTFGHSLNEGIRAAAGKYVAMVSAHAHPVDANWLGSLVEPLRAEGTAMVFGRQLGGTESKFGEALDFARTFGSVKPVQSWTCFVGNNANSGIRRDLWEDHPFDEALPGLEDLEWAKHWTARGYNVIYEPSAAVYHVHQESWEQVRRRYYREGMAAKWMGLRRRRRIPYEVLREASYFLGDLVAAARSNYPARRWPQIARFRFEKLTGTLGGIWDGAALDNPLTRQRLFFEGTYKAVKIHGPGRASLEDVVMAPLKPSEVLIKVAYQGVCGTDLDILDGELGYYKSGFAKYPIVPGHEFSGRVAGLGGRVSHLSEGDPVVVECLQGCGECSPCRGGDVAACPDRSELGVFGRDGGYAQFVVTAGRFVHRLPDRMRLADASLCEPLAVVLKGIRRLKSAWGESVQSRECAVAGGGPIGQLAARLLALQGHRVTVFDRNATRRACCDGTGICVATDFQDLTRFAAIVEATGDAEALDHILHNSRAGATLLLLGLPYAKRDFSFEAVVAYDKTVVGSVGSGAGEFQEAIALLPKLDLNLFTQCVYPLDRYAEAWEAARSLRHLKVLIGVDTSLG